MTATSVVDRQRFARVDADPDLCCGMIRVFASLREYIDDELADRDRAVHPLRLAVVRLRNDRMQPLIMKVDEQGVHA